VKWDGTLRTLTPGPLPAGEGAGPCSREREHSRSTNRLRPRKITSGMASADEYELRPATVLKAAVKLYQRYGFRPYHAEHRSSRCDQTHCLDLQQPG